MRTCFHGRSILLQLNCYIATCMTPFFLMPLCTFAISKKTSWISNELQLIWLATGFTHFWLFFPETICSKHTIFSCATFLVRFRIDSKISKGNTVFYCFHLDGSRSSNVYSLVLTCSDTLFNGNEKYKCHFTSLINAQQKRLNKINCSSTILTCSYMHLINITASS